MSGDMQYVRQRKIGEIVHLFSRKYWSWLSACRTQSGTLLQFDLRIQSKCWSRVDM